MTSVHVAPGAVLVLQVDNAAYLRDSHPALYADLVECAAFVNWRRLERGLPPVIALSFYV